MSNTIRAFAKQCQFTHATGADRGLVLLYSTETCEACDCTIQAANAIKIEATVEECRAAGLTVAPVPEEGGWSDTFGGVTCGCA